MISGLRVSGEDGDTLTLDLSFLDLSFLDLGFLNLGFLDLGLTEILLCVLCVLLYRIGNVLVEALNLLRDVKSTGRTQVTRISRTTRSQPAAKVQPGPALLERPLSDSAQLFRASLLDDADVDTYQFSQACRHFESGVLVRLGAFTMMGAIAALKPCTQTMHSNHALKPHSACIRQPAA